MSDRVYVLTYVKKDGRCFTTTAFGYHAESMIDLEFKAVRADPKVVFAMVVDGETPRQVYHNL